MNRVVIVLLSAILCWATSSFAHTTQIRQPCSLLVDDFSHPETHHNDFRQPTSSFGTMNETFGNHSIQLGIASNTSRWFSRLGCHDVSQYTHLRFVFLGDLPSTNFWLQFQTGYQSSCRSVRASKNLRFSAGILTKLATTTEVKFDLKAFGFPDQQYFSRPLQMILQKFGPETVGQSMTLTRIEFVDEVKCPPNSTSTSTNKRSEAQVANNILSIDDFSSSQQSTDKKNKLGACASDNGSCSRQWTTNGLSLSGSAGCYYYSFMGSCYSAPSDSYLKITLYSPPSGWAFTVSLHTRDATCTGKGPIFFVTTLSYSAVAESSSLVSVSIPLKDFASRGADLTKLNAWILQDFTGPITIRSLELISPSAGTTTSAPSTSSTTTTTGNSQGSVVIDDFKQASNVANFQNLLGGYASDDQTCGMTFVSSGGINLKKLTGCYYYTLFPSCYQLSSTAALKITYLSDSAVSFSITLQERNADCKSRQSSYVVQSSSYSPSIISSNTRSITIPLAHFASQGATLTRGHGLLWEGFSDAVTLLRVEIVSNA